MKTERMFVVIVALQGLILASLWSGHPFSTSNAQAAAIQDLPDPGVARERQLDELRKLNDKMDRLLDILSGGKLQVRAQSADQK